MGRFMLMCVISIRVTAPTCYVYGDTFLSSFVRERKTAFQRQDAMHETSPEDGRPGFSNQLPITLKHLSYNGPCDIELFIVV